MTNGWDSNGWEREPFGIKGNVRNPEYEFDGPAKWQKPARRRKDNDDDRAAVQDERGECR